MNGNGYLNLDNSTIWFSGFIFGGVISLVQLGFSPWLSHFALEFSFFHFIHCSLMYGILTGVVLTVVQRVQFAYFRWIIASLVPLPLVIWLHWYSLLSVMEGEFLYWISLMGMYILSVLLLPLVIALVRTLGRRSKYLPIVILVVLLGVRLALPVSMSSDWILKRAQPTKSWELSSTANFPRDMFFPLSRSFFSLRGYLPENQVSGTRSIIVLVPDALRSDYLYDEMFGQTIAPNMRSMASEAVDFQNYRVQSTWTKPSVASFFTGRYLRYHSVYWGGRFNVDSRNRAKGPARSHVLPERYLTLAERLRERGYETFGTTINFLSGKHYNFDQGFDTFLGPTEGFHDDPYVLNQAIFWLNRHRDEKKFVYLHTSGVHWHYPNALENTQFMEETYFFNNGELVYQPQYDIRESDVLQAARHGELSPPISDEDFFRTLYASQLNYYDRRIFKPFLAYLESKGHIADGLFVLTSDHGELLFEHDLFGHGQSLYEEVIHVPLVIQSEGQSFPSGTEIDQDVETVDLTSTLLDFGGAPGRGIQGESLLPLLRGNAVRGSFSHSFSEHVSHGMHGEDYRNHIEEVAVMDFPWKYIYNYDTSRDRLFNLKKSVGKERRSVNKPAVAKKLRSVIQEELGSDSRFKSPSVSLRDVEPSPEGNLRNLGYLE